ncbi:MAG: glycoside hydrolase family 6 protein [Pseudomonadota bacterium]|nr:glycoside hydrolase family 6 protein [Pseudomonadota bacterium]
MTVRSTFKGRRPLKALAPLISAALLPGCFADAATAPVSGAAPRLPDNDKVAEPPEDHPAHPSFSPIHPADLIPLAADEEEEDAQDPPDVAESSDSEDAPLGRYSLYVEPDSHPAQQASTWRTSDPAGAAAMDRMAEQPTATWLGDWDNDVARTVDNAVTTGAEQLRVFVVYNIPNRDCGFYSSGGASDADAYATFIDEVARGLDGRLAVVILEPDGLALTTCLNADQTVERQEMIAAAVDTLTAAGARVYIDAGDSAWISATEMAAKLIAAGIYNAAGFALNVAHTESTPDTIGYADEVRAILGDVHYVADTGRNGIGPDDDHTWCNPLGRVAGENPTLSTGVPGLDAMLWIKPPGESDGDCNGGPTAGAWWPEYARGLMETA